MVTAEQRPQLTVRAARGDDAAALREIFNEAVEDGLTTFETAPRSLEEQHALIAAAEKDPKHPIFVAELRNWVCGLAAIETHDTKHALDDMGEAIIFVRRSFRSFGVGRQLMRMVQAEAARLGYRKLIGKILADSTDTLRLCMANGWRVVGRYEKHARHGQVFRDVEVVEYLLPGPVNTTSTAAGAAS